MKWVEIKTGNDLPKNDGVYITIDKDNEVAKFWFSNDYPIKWEWLRGNTRTGNLVGDNSHIKKWLDESQPSGGKSAEDVKPCAFHNQLTFSGDDGIEYCSNCGEPITKYASQYAHQQPVNDGWVRVEINPDEPRCY